MLKFPGRYGRVVPYVRYSSQAPQRPQPKFSGRGSPSRSPGESTYIQEHDYTVTPTTYTYTAEANQEQFERFPMVTAKILANRKERPQRVRMLSREFIDDSMYNPNYGYFSKVAEIFTPDAPFEFKKMQNIETFLDKWSAEYKKQAVKPDKVIASDSEPQVSGQTRKSRPRVSRQLWHTPTELFHPFYGWALARHILATRAQEEDLVIYETGAGNGTLMVDILDYIRRESPEVYARTRYNIIEISASLALKQRAHAAGHSDRVNIVNRSIFEWVDVQPEPCFFIALEVWDNLAHDVVRYDNTTDEPYQGYVVVDANGDFTEIFSKKLDPLLRQALDLRNSVKWTPRSDLGMFPLRQPRAWRYLRNAVLPMHGNLSPPEYIPTRFVELLNVLRRSFPRHQLLAADFTTLGERTKGYTSPVVQTFMEAQPVAISTYMALQGYFDIMFPTDFELARKMYTAVTGHDATVTSHSDFMRQWAEPNATATKSGEDPMVSFYQNAAFLHTNAAPRT